MQIISIEFSTSDISSWFQKLQDDVDVIYPMSPSYLKGFITDHSFEIPSIELRIVMVCELQDVLILKQRIKGFRYRQMSRKPKTTKAHSDLQILCAINMHSYYYVCHNNQCEHNKIRNFVKLVNTFLSKTDKNYFLTDNSTISRFYIDVISRNEGQEIVDMIQS